MIFAVLTYTAATQFNVGHPLQTLRRDVIDSKKVYVIDEIDRSLHTMLTRCLIEVYLAKCNKNSRKQLLLTTQDLLLMDQKIFRLDEMWLTESDIDGASNLLSFSEYKDARNDKHIRKSYLQGRVGGIPHILSPSFLQI